MEIKSKQTAKGPTKHYWIAPKAISGYIVPCEPEHEVPLGYSQIEGYGQRALDVLLGTRDPWWGTRYKLNWPTKYIDFLGGSPIGVKVVSPRFRAVVDENGYKGIKFHAIEVEEIGEMFIIGISGRMTSDYPDRIEIEADQDFGISEDKRIITTEVVVRQFKKHKIKLFAELLTRDILIKELSC